MHWQFGEMEFGEMKRNTSNWSNFCILLSRAGLSASAELSCCFDVVNWVRYEWSSDTSRTGTSWTEEIAHIDCGSRARSGGSQDLSLGLETSHNMTLVSKSWPWAFGCFLVL